MFVLLQLYCTYADTCSVNIVSSVLRIYELSRQTNWADYWKSNPRHFCKFCLCWIADNKPSRDFHEKGKRHQENVQKKISEVRKKSVKDSKKKDEENSYMKEMEENAKKAFLQDLKSDPKLAQHYLEKARKKKEFVESKKKRESPSVKQQQPDTSNTDTKEHGGTWRITHSPEGYPYYWNDVTGVVSWTEPEDGHIEYDTDQTADQEQSAEQMKSEGQDKELNTDDSQSDEDNEPEDVPSSSDVDQNKDEESSENEEGEDSTDSASGEQRHDKVVNRGNDKTNETSQPSLPTIDPHDISAIPLPGDIPLPPPPHTLPPPLPPPQNSQPPLPRTEPAPPGIDLPPNPPRHEYAPPPPSGSGQAAAEEPEDQSGERRQKRGHDSAYGGWEQVVYEEPEQVDLQLPETEQYVEEKVIQISEPKVKFREKKVNSLGADLVAFKKRKMNSRNLKQRGDS